MAAARQNTPGLGIEYEVHLPAYFALLLNSNSEIEDFRLRSNVEEFGNLDDLLVDIKTKRGENLYFAFQLKHKEKSSKNLLPTNFEARGDFNLEKYCEAFKKLNDDNRKYHFILYTNKNFDSSRSNEVKRFDMRLDECCLGRNFFDTSGDGKNLYKFEVNSETEDGKNVNKEDYRKFFSQFSLYTGQANIRDLDKSHILDILKYKECYVTYIDFFRRWHRGDFIDKILDKKTLNIHLVDILLSSVTINYHFSDGKVENSNFFEAMVQQFDITIIDAFKQDFIKQLEENVLKYPGEFNNLDEIIKLGKKTKFIDRFTKELNEKTKHKLLHYFFHKPLILDFYKSSEDLIYEATKLCKIQENEIKLVILGQDIDVSKFSHLKIFTNLIGVNENFLEEAKRRCNLSLQVRNFLFEEIFEDWIRQFVTPKDIFQMLIGTFSIEEDKEELPEIYIPRYVSTAVFDIESVIRQSSSSSFIIFYCKNKFEDLKFLIETIVKPKSHFYEYLLDQTTIVLKKKERTTKQLPEDFQNKHFLLPTIVVRKGEYSKTQLNEVFEELRKAGKIYEETEKENLHVFQVVDEKRCLLLMSTKNKFHNENYTYTKASVRDNRIHVVFKGSINILCAQPGMGKSTLMKYLRNECVLNFWTVMVDLKTHNDFLKRNHKIEAVLNHFLQLENYQDLFLLNIKKMFMRNKKIVFFLDGVDEVDTECVDYVLNITSQLSDMGFRIWLSSRQNLQQKIEHYFNILAIEINVLQENQQKNYIQDKLKSMYNKNEIEEMVKKVFNNSQLVDNHQMLETPLQLQIITQIFLEDNSYYSNLSENNFIFTKMFEIFFEGKYKHFLTKLELKSPHLLGKLEERLEKYELVALHYVLDEEHFQKLQIENFKLPQNKNWDFLGILKEVNTEKKIVFEHLTFAEYFASKFLVKNFNKARILREEIFSVKYQNLRILLNIMLAEDSPLHLAIIHKDFDRIDEGRGQSTLVDKGGRNFLQLIACFATRHPTLESNSGILFRNNSWLIKKLAPAMFTGCLVKDMSVWEFKGEDSKIRKIVNRILPSEPFKNDEIFDWNSLDYALVHGALYIVEAILVNFEKPFNFYEILGKYYSDEVVAYYSIRFGYHRLLSEIIAKNSVHVTGIVSDYLSEENKFIPHVLFNESDCTNKIRIVELLIGDDVNKIVDDLRGYTFLHFAVCYEDIELINFLLEKKVDVKYKEKQGKSPLYLSVYPEADDIKIKILEYRYYLLASKKHNFEISKLLVEKGADVNIKDKEYGRSPLFWAVNRNELEFSKLLVEKGAYVNIRDKLYGRTPLLCAVVDQNNFEISKLLIEKGADVNVKDKYGRTPLLGAVVDQNNFEISKLLIEKGADVNVKDKCGRTPLFFSFFEYKNLDISKLLIEKGADFNIRDNSGELLLFSALYRHDFEILKLLVEKGANVNIREKENNRPLSPLLFFDESLPLHYKLIRRIHLSFLEDRITPLWSAIKEDNLKISKLLIENGADVNIKDKNGRSPLFFFVSGRHRCDRNFEMCQLLIEKGANVNIKDKQYGRSALFCAINEGMHITRHNSSSDVNIEDDKTPFLCCKNERNNLDFAKLLIEKGAKVNIRDKYGKSILFWALEQNDVEIAKLLIEKGANVNIKTRNGESPLLLAIKKRNQEIAKLLFKSGAKVNSEVRDEFYSRRLIYERGLTLEKYLQ